MENAMSLEVLWYGHANVMLRENGVTVLVDPFFEGNPFAPDWRSIPKPDVIAVTHDHGDHIGQAMDIARETGAKLVCIADLADYFREQGLADNVANYGIGGNIDGTLEVCGAKFTFTQAFHSTKHGSPVGFVIEMLGGHTVYHAGDTGLFGDMALIAERFDIDLAFLPAGGVFTMDGPLAAKAAALLKAKAAMPIHYATFPVLAPDAEAFVEALREKAPHCRPFVMRPNTSAVLD